jgi:hypothetical protein
VPRRTRCADCAPRRTSLPSSWSLAGAGARRPGTRGPEFVRHLRRSYGPRRPYGAKVVVRQRDGPTVPRWSYGSEVTVGQSSPLTMFHSGADRSVRAVPSAVAGTQVRGPLRRRRRAMAHPVSGRTVVLVLMSAVTALLLPSLLGPRRVRPLLRLRAVSVGSPSVARGNPSAPRASYADGHAGLRCRPPGHTVRNGGVARRAAARSAPRGRRR